MIWNDKPPFYPSAIEIEHWVNDLHQQVMSMSYLKTDTGHSGVTPMFGNGHNTNYTRFWKYDVPGRESFYAIWQPALRSPAPVVIHLPGYGAETSVLPELVQAGYHVLHISPLGYMTPEGPNEKLKINGDWPVLGYTTHGMPGGYRDWLLDAMIAINDVRQHPDVMGDRLLFFGTSQGGGTSILLGSIYRDYGARAVVADVPFLTDIISQDYPFYMSGLTPQTMTTEHWKNLGFVDTLSHMHRLTVPVLLTAGSVDTACPPQTIMKLFHHLECTKSLNYFNGQGHAYTRQVIHLGLAWLNIHS